MTTEPAREVLTLVCPTCSRGSEVTIGNGAGERAFPPKWGCPRCLGELEIRGRRWVVALAEIA